MILVYTLVIGAASYRVWRLLAEDTITEAPRVWLLERSPAKVTELVECPWCLGSWFAFAATWATDAIVGLPAPVLVGLAAAVVVGWLGSHL